MRNTIKFTICLAAMTAILGAVAYAMACPSARALPFRAAWTVAEVSHSRTLIAQDGDQIDEPEVPQSQVGKYIAVYKAMQRDHSLTITRAAAQQGFTVKQFRTLENRIMSNDVLHAQVRKALREAARATATASPGN